VTVVAPFTSELAASLAPDVRGRFLRYVRVDTQSQRDRTRSPSTPGQLELGWMLVDELRVAGLEDAALDANGYVTASLPATAERGGPVVGLIAHVDTSPDAPGAGVEPLVHERYDGAVLRLPRGGTVLDPAVLGELAGRAGHDIVTSSGDTLLGADDKAGVAEILAAVARLAAHPELPRPVVRVCFTPDEEIGEGATLFDTESFGADFAYTVDGSALGELQDETFSAVEVRLTFNGLEVHPGYAAGKLVNAAKLAARVLAALPADRLSPETTSGREGFIHPYAIEGTASRAEVRAIVRDFDDDLLDDHVALLRALAEDSVAQAPGARLEVDVREQYRNMRNHLASVPEVVQAAERAMRAEGIEVVRQPIRGGTDGSRLSAMGLPTPNLFAGGHEFHSLREWVSVQDMAAAAATLVRLAGEWA
jgi:tripeptide aminopeptidase